VSKSASRSSAAKRPSGSASKSSGGKSARPVARPMTKAVAARSTKGGSSAPPRAKKEPVGKSSGKKPLLKAKGSAKPPVPAKGNAARKSAVLAGAKGAATKAPGKSVKAPVVAAKPAAAARPAKRGAEVKGKTGAAPKQPVAAAGSSKKSKAGSAKESGAAPRSVAAAAIASLNQPRNAQGYVFINGRRVRMISTKGLTLPKKSKSAATAAAAPAAPDDEKIRSIRTKLTDDELGKYRELLREKRRELVGMLSGMEEEALRSSGGNLSNMPLHMADVGTDTYDQDFTLGMAETERKLLAEIDAALGRITNRTYGVCQMTGKPIPKARLAAKPWAKYTIEAARIVESTQGR